MVSACHSPTLAVSKHVLLQIHVPNRRVFSWRREWHAFTEATGPPNNRWTSKKLSSFRFLELENEDQHTFSKTCPIFSEPSRIFWKMSAQTANVSCFCQGAEAFHEILHWVLHLVEVCFQFSQFSAIFARHFQIKSNLSWDGYRTQAFKTRLAPTAATLPRGRATGFEGSTKRNDLDDVWCLCSMACFIISSCHRCSNQ